MKTYGEWRFQTFSTSALDEGECSASRPCRFTHREIARLRGPQSGLHDVERIIILPLPGLELRPLGHRKNIPTIVTEFSDYVHWSDILWYILHLRHTLYSMPSIIKLGTSGTHWMWGWVRPKADLDTVEKSKISCPFRKSNPKSSTAQPVARRYTDWAIPAPKLSSYLT
jgi:hypothetical protein